MDWLLLDLRLLAVVVLYVFLAVAVYVIWLDLRSGAEGQPGLSLEGAPIPDLTVPAPSARMVIVELPSPADSSPREFFLAPQTRIGRAEGNDIVLADDCVSSRHAEVVFRNGGWWLQDLASRNGTSLNGAVIEGPVILRHGDIVGVGNVALTLDLNLDAQSENKERRLEWNQSD